MIRLDSIWDLTQSLRKQFFFDPLRQELLGHPTWNCFCATSSKGFHRMADMTDAWTDVCSHPTPPQMPRSAKSPRNHRQQVHCLENGNEKSAWHRQDLSQMDTTPTSPRILNLHPSKGGVTPTSLRLRNLRPPGPAKERLTRLERADSFEEYDPACDLTTKHAVILTSHVAFSSLSRRRRQDRTRSRGNSSESSEEDNVAYSPGPVKGPISGPLQALEINTTPPHAETKKMQVPPVGSPRRSSLMPRVSQRGCHKKNNDCGAIIINNPGLSF